MGFLDIYRNRRQPTVREVFHAARDAERARAGRIKSYRMRHDWQITGGGYLDPGDGKPGFPTTSARCQRCGEEANGFTAPLDRFMALRGFGCWRDGFDGRYQRDDLVQVDGRLDYFLNYLPDGRCATANLGGDTYTADVADLVAVR